VFRQPDFVAAAVGGDDDLRMLHVGAQHRAAAAGREALFDRELRAVRLEDRQLQKISEIEREEALRQISGGIVAERLLRTWARLAFLRDGREAVIGGDEDVCVRREALLLQCVTQRAERIRSEPDRGERAWAVDARRQLTGRILLRML